MDRAQRESWRGGAESTQEQAEGKNGDELSERRAPWGLVWRHSFVLCWRTKARKPEDKLLITNKQLVMEFGW